MRTEHDRRREIAHTTKLQGEVQADLDSADGEYAATLKDTLNFYRGKLTALRWMGETPPPEDEPEEAPPKRRKKK